MGLFSGETVVEVATTVSRAVTDVNLPHSIKTGALKGILANGNIADYAMEEMVSSIALRAERLYSYAENGYTHGSPSGEFHSSIQGSLAVQAVLDSLAGQPVVMDYCHFGPPNKLHIGWIKLMELHGYKPSTNQLGVLTLAKGVPVYLTNVTVVVPIALVGTFEAGALDQWGNAASSGYLGYPPVYSEQVKSMVKHTLVFASPEATQVEVLVDYQWRVGSRLFNESLTIPITGYDGNAGYFQVRYTYAGESHYAIYKIGTGTYPSLDSVFDTVVPENGQFYPFAYFRFNKQEVKEENGAEAYLSSKKLVKYIGMDFDTISENINTNPNIKDVEQAMLMLAVPAVTSNQVEMLYLFDFFNQLFYSAPEQFSSRNIAQLDAFFDDSQGISKNAIVIQDKLFKMALSNDGLYKKTYTGSLGRIGTCTTGITTETIDKDFTVSVGQGDVVVETRQIPLIYHWYRKQVSEVTYEEVRVLNLKTVYYIYQGYTAIGDDTSSILLVPIDRSISKGYTMNIREELYSRSLHYVFNSVVITHLKWYQTGIFQILMIIVAIVVSIYTLDPEIAMWAIAVQSGTMSLVAFVVALATTYLVPYLATTLAIKYFVKAVGAEFAFLVAIFAAAYGSFKAFNAQSIAGAPWAQELLSLANGLTNAISNSIGETIQGLKKDYDEFSLDIKKQYELLGRAESNLLEDSNRLSSFVIFGESPNDYYARTIHSGNIGVRGIDMVKSYVDIALTLPKIADTLVF